MRIKAIERKWISMEYLTETQAKIFLMQLGVI